MTTTEAIHRDHVADSHGVHAHEAPSYDDVNTPVIVLVGVISAIITLLTIMFVQGLCYHWQNSYIKLRTTDAVSMPANQQIQNQQAILKGGDGIVPITEAMQKVVAKYGK